MNEIQTHAPEVERNICDSICDWCGGGRFIITFCLDCMYSRRICCTMCNVIGHNSEKCPSILPLQDYIAKYVKPRIISISSTQNQKTIRKLEFNKFKFGYLCSSKGEEFLDYIRMISKAEIITLSNYDNTGGMVIICGDEKGVIDARGHICEFVKTTPWKILPRDSRLAAITMRVRMDMLESAKGNCSLIYNVITEKKCELLKEYSNYCKKEVRNDIVRLYALLHMLLFGRCRIKNADKHLDRMYKWMKKFATEEAFEVPLSCAFDLFESYCYIFKAKIYHENYSALAAAANYYIRKSPAPKGHMTWQQNRVFVRKMSLIQRQCRKHNLYKQLGQLNCIKEKVISQYSTSAFIKFMKFANMFRRLYPTFIRNNNNGF